MTTSSSNLREFMESGTFRRDLYFQLDVMRLVVPPLRQRVEDLPLLLEAFDLQARDDGPTLRFSERAVKLLNAYTWPGNLRELKNEVLRLKARGEPRVSGKFLSDEIREGRGVAAPGNFAGMTLGDVEREMVRLAVDRCGGNKARAARQLGIPRSTLYHLIQRHGL
jgi:DNA-binding NtrC family response regulator